MLPEKNLDVPGKRHLAAWRQPAELPNQPAIVYGAHLIDHHVGSLNEPSLTSLQVDSQEPDGLANLRG